jgi:hypothetical protein
MPLGLDMDLADQRTGCIDVDHLAPFGLGGDGFRDPVCREDDRAIIRAVRQMFDKDRTLVTQAVDDKFVVHDFVPDIDRSAPFLQRDLDDLYRAVDASAESARCSEV